MSDDPIILERLKHPRQFKKKQNRERRCPSYIYTHPYMHCICYTFINEIKYIKDFYRAVNALCLAYCKTTFLTQISY